MLKPSKVLTEEFMKPNKINVNKLSMETGISHSCLYDIINKERKIMPAVAIKLAKFFCNTPEFWLNLESNYQLAKELSKELARCNG